MTEIVQGSPEWHALRLGKVTASRAADVVAKTKTGWGASRANYMAELIAERLTGVPAESYMNAAMQWGIDKEPDARAAYEWVNGCEVEQAAFIEHATIALTGCSPDGLVGNAGLVELKCPNTATHIDTLLGSEIDKKYLTQMQWQMACTDRQWCDFVSFDPRMPESMRLYVKRIPRDDVAIKSLEKDIKEFLAELDNKVQALRSQYELKSLLAAG